VDEDVNYFFNVVDVWVVGKQESGEHGTALMSLSTIVVGHVAGPFSRRRL